MPPHHDRERFHFLVTGLTHGVDQGFQIHAAAVSRREGERSGRCTRSVRRNGQSEPRIRQRPVVRRQQTVGIVEPDPRVHDREPRTGPSWHHVVHARMTAQETLFVYGPLVKMPCGRGHRQRRRRRVAVHEHGIGDPDQGRSPVDLGVLEHRRLCGIGRRPQNQRRVDPVPAHPGEVRADRMIARQARRVRMAECVGAGARACNEARERSVARRLEGCEDGKDEDHRTTSTSVCP